MNFNSLHFALFFALVLAACVATQRRVGVRNGVLLVASYYFYGCWDYRFLSLILVSTVIDYTCGRLLDVRDLASDVRPIRSTRHKRIVLVSVVANLGILGFFKYYDFFITSASALIESLGMHADAATLDIILPVGISFYTFQTMSYTIDLYRGKVTTERSLLSFAVFVAFFPQLVAGPIERASKLLPQIRSPHRMSWPRFWTGFYLIAVGLFKKVVIADNVALVADEVFGASQYSGLDVVLGSYAFAIQIYCDFSGYSDIARGAARCLGYDLMLNFNLPYFAISPSDFWQRWHISLSSWLRDYLYVPLGGNRKGKRRTYVNLMLTMVLGGLWHGAAWTFVAWGVFHGLLLCIYRVVGRSIGEREGDDACARYGPWYWCRVLFFFHLICASWILFRASSIGHAGDMFAAIISGFADGVQAMTPASLLVLAASMVALGSVQLLQWWKRDLLALLRLPVVLRGLVYAAGILGFLFFGRYAGESFIYFQF